MGIRNDLFNGDIESVKRGEELMDVYLKSLGLKIVNKDLDDNIIDVEYKEVE